MSRWQHVREFRREIQWTVVVLVLAALAVVALWPGGSGGGDSQAGSPSDPRQRTASPVDPALRGGLEPCPAPQPGGPAALAGVTGTCLADGTPVDVGAALAGRPALINVWATWCGPCRTELPAVQAYSERPGSVPVLGVQVQSDEAGGLELLRELGARFPGVHDPDGAVRSALRVPNVLPASFVITAGGEVRRIDPPEVFESADAVDAAVRRTLGGRS
ncbi:TlpA disulfide reductase family protein [Saccharopolyspora gloriosae]|uniref:TlpA family protein disulfide reductase n=1 Tax=Saccharopolyspora gloriosae TaxID=455344 RepID=UPI001FB84703|nr:TlpA disulfide reductase family protein [Saccharopolyspora gloriosae]